MFEGRVVRVAPKANGEGVLETWVAEHESKVDRRKISSRHKYYAAADHWIAHSHRITASAVTLKA